MLLAFAQDDQVPLSPAAQAELDQIGASVAAEGGCPYARLAVPSPPMRLWSVRFGTSTVVQSGAFGEVDIAGHQYDAWAQGVGFLGFSMLAR